jgi:hypothetical protein
MKRLGLLALMLAGIAPAQAVDDVRHCSFVAWADGEFDTSSVVDCRD